MNVVQGLLNKGMRVGAAAYFRTHDISVALKDVPVVIELCYSDPYAAARCAALRCDKTTRAEFYQQLGVHKSAHKLFAVTGYGCGIAAIPGSVASLFLFESLYAPPIVACLGLCALWSSASHVDAASCLNQAQYAVEEVQGEILE